MKERISDSPLPVLTGLLPEEIGALLPPDKRTFRGTQIFRWIHERGATSFDEMTNLPKDFRAEAARSYRIGAVEMEELRVSADRSTGKFLWRLADGSRIESVLIRDEDRLTACISSQVGCRMGCVFCRTGGMGFVRNLTAGEIVDQLIAMRRQCAQTGESITNVVFMGMGEPLDNLEQVMKAIRIINMEIGLGMGQRKVTVSTAGLMDGVNRLAGTFRKIGLAVSLNAVDDEGRSRLMPLNKRYPIDAVIEGARNFHRITKRRVTFEYILMAGINDSPRHARGLVSLTRRVPSKINLIAFNEHGDSPIRRPDERAIGAFQQILCDNHVTAMLRKSKGGDILAACGQLAADKEQ